MGAELALVVQRRARAIGHAHHIDLIRAQALAHRIEVLHGQRGRKKGQVRGLCDEG